MTLSRTSYRPNVEALEDRLTPALPSAAPPLGAIPGNAVWVSNETELYNAVDNLQSGQTVVLRNGTYNITRSLQIRNVSNVTIRGETDDFGGVHIRNAGGWENQGVGYIFWIGAQDVTLANMRLSEAYYHNISMEGPFGADRIRVYHCWIQNAGQQLIKGNPGGSNGGVEDTVIEYSLLEYTNGPPTTDHGGGLGYMGAAHIHNAINWVFRHNVIRGVVAPESYQHSTPANILAWNQSRGTIVEYNTFIDNVRGVAFGLWDRDGFDHSGGRISNNFFYVRDGLLTTSQMQFNSQVIVYDSPNTEVIHNTFLIPNQVASHFPIEFLGASTNGVARNNLANNPIGSRSGATWTGSGNYLAATANMFVNPAAGDLHLLDNATTRTYLIDKVSVLAGIDKDWDVQTRSGLADIGADEIASAANQAPTIATPAAASPSPVTGTTTALSVLGADDAGQANLTYTWAATVIPAGATPSFSANGTNAARNSTVTFNRAGSYTFLVTVRDAGGLTATSSVAVVVNQTLTSIAVSPASASVPAGSTRQFSATARDQFGIALAVQPSFAWSTSGGGTINASGLFTAGSTAGGPFTVTAASGGRSGTASVTITAVNAPPTVATAAAASPNPVAGTTASLSVLGADNGGEGSLTYTWATTGTPPAPVTFSVNGTNAAKNTTATFSRAGSYTLQATIRDAAGLTVTSNVTVTVNQTLTSISVTPASVTLSNGGTQQFTASARDQFGVAMSAPIAWSLASGVGSISTAGLYTAPAAGSGAATVRAASGSISGTASVTVVPVSSGDGLTATYFDNSNFTGPSVIRIDSNINFDWAGGSPVPGSIGVDTFSSRWTGQLQPRFTGTYTFFTTSDDGVRLWVNDVLILDQWNDHAPTTHTSAPIALTAGVKVNIRMEYYENGGGAVAKLEWQSASQAREIVPQSQLFSGSAPAVPAAPSGLTASAVSSTAINLAWTDHSNNETGFQIERSTNGVNYSLHQTVAAGVTTFADTGLAAGTTYYYRVRATGAAGSSAFSNVASAATLPVAGGNGLTAVYFDNSNFTGASVTRIDPTINFNWGSGSPAPSIGVDTFSARWTGQIQPRYSESYTFFTTSDDGVRLWINGQLLIDQWNDHAPTTHGGAITLTAGQRYDIRLDYYENGGGAVARLEWQSASQAREIVPQSQLFHTASTAAKLTGTVIGTTGSWSNMGNTRDKAFDGSLATFFDAPDPGNGAWVGLDLGTPARLTQIRYAPRPTLAARMVGGVFQGSNTADFSSGVVNLFTVSSAPPEGVFTTAMVSDLGSYRYVRFLSPNGGYGNIAELEFAGIPTQ